VADELAGRVEARTAGVADVPVVVAVREAIIRGDFAPNQRLVEADLSAHFSASRANVRAALIELANEGLVERVQNRGARVRSISVEEAVEISEVRMVLEALCAEKAAESVDAEQAKELREIGRVMRRAVAGGDVVGYSRLNERLHRRIREIGGQRTAAQVLERLRAQSVRHQFRLAMRPGRPAVSLPQHLAIIDAICAHDVAEAHLAMRRHMESVIAALVESGEPDVHTMQP
jgi:DNA-binding GntR family transcriptional regulator